jgi:hypothetical protein
MKRISLSAVLLCVLAISVPALCDSKDEALQETIDYLVEYVRSSDVVFIRNDKEHSPEDAASHMLKKYKYAKRKVKAPEDFIKHCATKSTMSGKPYHVRLASGRTITSAEWLLSALEDYRSGGSQAAAGGLVYDMKEFRKHYGSCPNPQEDCASVVIRYPELAGTETDTGLAAIAREIRRRLTVPVYEKTEPWTYDELAETFIESYKKTQADFPDYTTGWTLEREASVVFSSDSLISLAFTEMSFTGGAHPSARKAYSCLRLSDGSVVGLDDFLVQGYEEELTRAGEMAFREARGLQTDESLEDAGFWFEGGTFRLNGNFAMTAAGLVFHFNAYEIAPYAMGPTEFAIPYEDISSLIRKEGLFKGVIK